MSYQERRTIIEIISMLITNTVYGWLLFSQYIVKRPELLEDLRFWAIVLLILVPLSIVSRIITEIIHAIYHAIRTGEEAPMENDERDTLIELKASRMAHITFSLSFVLALGLVVLGQSMMVMFLTLLIGGMVSEITDNVSKYIFYTRGV